MWLWKHGQFQRNSDHWCVLERYTVYDRAVSWSLEEIWYCIMCPLEGRWHICSDPSQGSSTSCPQPQLRAPHNPPFNSVQTNPSDGLLRECHHLTEWDHVSPTLAVSCRLTAQEFWSGGQRLFQIWKGRDKCPHARTGARRADVTVHCRGCHSARQRQQWNWYETRGVSCAVLIFTSSWLWRMAVHQRAPESLPYPRAC